ncbi:MAG: hypothetical protein JWQ32_2183 [Marmoricola sp.]|nr:hypothetical protein [Marmoricola sp.]
MSDLQQRYGTPSRTRRGTLIVVSTLICALFLGWLGWAIWFRSNPAIEADIASFDVVNVHQVRIKIQTRFRDESVVGSCLFEATAADHTIVGDLNLTVQQMRSAGGNWIPLRTFDRATTVQRMSCTGH